MSAQIKDGHYQKRVRLGLNLNRTGLCTYMKPYWFQTSIFFFFLRKDYLTINGLKIWKLNPWRWI